ncbi:kinase-like domain-containing protein [Rhizophagus clarus]|uniref:Kinase-like domain-containing protein n=1 Tax=Rhizophagus clarus TaxID=94130 RepID=A0A8H3KXD3_9GLOM|nr:kinase-like domain-containing protein [Rhizophagus clarus]
METEFNKLNISDKNSDKNSNLKNINHGNCSYCNEPFTEELWCKKCDPFRMIEGWTSGNNDIDKFIKDIKQIGEGGFAKVYSATWIDGKTEYVRQDDGSWKKREPESLTVALKRLNGSQNMSIEYLNELKTHWNFNKQDTDTTLDFYGITKDPETKEFMMILEFAEKGNLRSFLLSDFNKIMWKDKIRNLYWITANLYDLHGLKYIHKDFHRKEVKAAFEEADKEIPNISTSYKKNPDAIYTSRLFTFNNLTKPVNSSIITSYLGDEENNNEDNQDPQLVDLEVPSSLLQSKDDDDIDNEKVLITKQ